MEDYGITHYFSPTKLAVLVCDGHGSICYAPGRYIGGYESARFVTQYILSRLKKHFETHAFETNVEHMIRDIFDETQSCLLRHMVEYKEKSKIDGFHFKHVPEDAFVHDKEQEKQPFYAFEKNDRSTTRQHALVFPQLTSRCKSKKTIIDYGTTATLVLIINHDVYVANVGDSDVYLYEPHCLNGSHSACNSFHSTAMEPGHTLAPTTVTATTNTTTIVTAANTTDVANATIAPRLDDTSLNDQPRNETTTAVATTAMNNLCLNPCSEKTSVTHHPQAVNIERFEPVITNPSISSSHSPLFPLFPTNHTTPLLTADNSSSQHVFFYNNQYNDVIPSLPQPYCIWRLTSEHSIHSSRECKRIQKCAGSSVVIKHPYFEFHTPSSPVNVPQYMDLKFTVNNSSTTDNSFLLHSQDNTSIPFNQSLSSIAYDLQQKSRLQENIALMHHVYTQNNPYNRLPSTSSSWITRRLMPSRSLGHAFLFQYGVSHRPAITVTKVSSGDWIIAGTDGFWDRPGIQYKIMNQLKNHDQLFTSIHHHPCIKNDNDTNWIQENLNSTTLLIHRTAEHLLKRAEDDFLSYEEQESAPPLIHIYQAEHPTEPPKQETLDKAFMYTPGLKKDNALFVMIRIR